MTASTAGTTDLSSDETVKTIVVTGLQNAHALEKEVLQLMQRQVERFAHYPEMPNQLRTPIRETEGEVRRLDEMLHTFGEDRCLLKDMATGYGDPSDGHHGGRGPHAHGQRSPEEYLRELCENVAPAFRRNDALLYSIGREIEPTSDAVSLCFLGIFSRKTGSHFCARCSRGSVGENPKSGFHFSRPLLLSPKQVRG